MSYAALATDRFDEVARFYGETLGFPVVNQWDRPNGRGRRFDLGGMRLEILDNARERKPMSFGEPGGRFHVVVETDDIEEARGRIKLDAPEAQSTSWGAVLFQVRDPDGVPVTFLQWLREEDSEGEEICGHLASGAARGQHFTRLDWARRQFADKLGIDPFPGTLNVIVNDPESRNAWEKLKASPGVSIANPNTGPNDCNARCFPVSVGGSIDAAIVLPEVEGYAPDQVEVIAAVGIREALGIGGGDPVTLEIKQDRNENHA